ncbi:MAG: acylphosphatase [Nitrososphaerota archaeon]
MKAFLARVYGRVQRVGFRRFVLDSAQELGLSGYVKNEKDGSVTVFAQGDDTIVERFIEMLKSPPPPAYVKAIDIEEVKPRPAVKYFLIKPSRLHEELQEGFGAMQSIFMDYWREFRDYRSEFRDLVGEFRDYRDEFRGFVGEFRDYRSEFRSFVGEFRDYREEFRGFAERTDKILNTILEKYGEISSKLATILETLTRESRETREMLNETINLLKEAIEKLSST